MVRNAAKTQTVRVLTTNGVLFCPGGRLPLDTDQARAVFELLVDDERVLAPVAGADDDAGAPRAVDQAWVRGRDRGEDSRTLTLVVLTSRAVLDGVQPLEVDEALAVYELLVTEHRVLMPGPDTFLPSEWRRAQADACCAPSHGGGADSGGPDDVEHGAVLDLEPVARPGR